MHRLGLAVPIEGLGLRESLELAVHAERLGYTDAWSYEVSGSDGFSPLAWLAANAPDLRLGISVIPAFTRPPALLAMSCAGLQDLSGGRFVLGLGSSSPNVVERWMGGTYERPLTRVRETVEALRRALAGGKAGYHGETLRMDDFRLGLAPVEVPVLLGALGPRMHRLAGEVGDGVVMVFNAVRTTPLLLADVAEGARAAGKDPADLDVVAKLFVSVDEDTPGLRGMLRRLVTQYGTVPAYNRLLRRQGFEHEAERMARAWADGRRSDATAAVTDELLDALMVVGDAAHCRRRLQAYADAGVRTLLVAPMTAAAEPAERRERILHTIEQVSQLAAVPVNDR